MRPPLRPALFFGIAFLFVALAITGCEPEFQDDLCESDQDCFPDETCTDGRCVFEEGWNECGGNEVLENSVGDPCGPCNLDEYRCPPGQSDPTSLECYPGNTLCPELDLVTQNPSDVGDRTATFHGMIQDFPYGAEVVELGFCWTEDGNDPTVDDSCAALDPVPSEPGEFSLDVDDLRPGTEHVVRAYSVTDVGTEDYGNSVDFLTGSPIPENVEATSSAEAVILNWDEIVGAVGYEVRIGEDDDEIHELEAPLLGSFQDESAPAGSLGVPQNPEASTDVAAGIEITWDPPQAVDGDAVTYEVAAIYPDARSEFSDPVDGYRSAPAIAGYQLYVSDNGSGEWISVGNDTSYLHDDAPKAPLTPGTISASNGTSAEHVLLQFEVDPDVGEAPEQAYRLRTIYGATQTMGGETSVFTGRRGTTESFDIQWFRSQGSDPSDFEEIAGANEFTYEDDAPAAGEVRYYYAEVDAVEANPEMTNTDSGYIAAGGAVADLQVSDITAESAELTAQLQGVGDPPAEQHGFCFSTDPDPSYGTDDCVELGVPDESSPEMSASLDADDLDPGTTYYVVAFVHSDSTGTVYSGEQPFTTAPAAPQGLEAQEGVLNWIASDGADEYRVYRDGTHIGTTADTTFSDDDDFDPLAPVNLSASDDDAAQITVQWEAADVEDGLEYAVIAVLDPGSLGATGALKESVPSDPAFDDLPQPDHYEIRYQIDGGDWSDWDDVGSTSHVFDDDAAPSIDFGTLSASDDNPDGILIDISPLDTAPIEASPGPNVNFEVRSVSSADETSDAVATTGIRDADDLQDHLVAQWQYEDDQSEWQQLTVIADIDNPEFLDDGPDFEEQRTYRVEAQLDGIDDTITESSTITGTRGEEVNGGD